MAAGRMSIREMTGADICIQSLNFLQNGFNVLFFCADPAYPEGQPQFSAVSWRGGRNILIDVFNVEKKFIESGFLVKGDLEPGNSINASRDWILPERKYFDPMIF